MIDQEWFTFLEEEHKITREVWQKHKLRFDQNYLYIPYFSKTGRVIFNKKRTAPNSTEKNKYLYGSGDVVQLWPYLDLSGSVEWVVTEGELDQLTLESQDIAAVTSGGVYSFKRHFTKSFEGKKVHICYDNDQSGKDGAERLAQTFLEAGIEVDIIELPEMEGGKDIGDFFKLGHTKEQFLELCQKARKVELKEQPGNRKKKEEDEEDKLPTSYSANFEGLIDLVQSEGVTAFLLKNPKTNEFIVTSSWELDHTRYLAPPIEKIPYLLPRAEQVLDFITRHKEAPCFEDKKLYELLLTYHQNVSDLPDSNLYHLLTIWDFHTYLIEQANYSPMLDFFAVAERGKSRTGKGLIFLARRGVRIESVSDAHIIRLANDVQATIFFDCMDLWKEVEQAGSRDVLLNRFERGIKVPRVLSPEQGPFFDTVYYDIFGPTILATNEPLHKILETRALPIIMQPSSKRFENDVTPEVALPLKEQLTAWRAVHLQDKLPQVSKLTSLRIGDILRPLHQIIKFVKPEYEPIFLEIAKNLENERLNDKAETLEADILLVFDVLKDKFNPITKRNFIDNGRISVQDITNELNSSKATEREKLSANTIGRRLKALGFEKTKTSDKRSGAAIFYDPTKIDQLKATYGLDKPSDSSETIISDTPTMESSEVSEINSIPGLEGYGK